MSNYKQYFNFYIEKYLFAETGAGDKELFAILEDNLVKAISADSVEWRRSYSQLPIKKVKLSPTFITFSKDVLPTEKNWHLVKQPIFHIYWTECSVRISSI